MKVIVVGCGRVGSALAYELYQKGHQVTVIDQDPASFDNLPSDFGGRTIEGDVLARSVLHRAEAWEAEALAAATRSDTLNVLIAGVAREEYGVARVVVRNYDPRQLPLQEAFGFPIVGAATWGAQRLEELLSDDPLRPVFRDEAAGVAVYHLEVPVAWQGRRLAELLPDGQALLGAARGGQRLAPADAERVQAGDLLTLSADAQEAEALRRRLAHGPQERGA